MKWLVILSIVAFVGVLNYPVPGIAAESNQTGLTELAPSKDECLLYLIQCDSSRIVAMSFCEPRSC